MVQEAADVLGQRRHRGVAAALLLLEGLREDVIDVAAIGPAQTVGSRVARANRIALEQRAQVLGRRPAAVSRRMAAGQQHVEQHAERVDVGRRGHRFATRLLGRGVFRRQRLRGRPGQRRLA